METEFKVLTYCGNYVDNNQLAKGIYTTNTPVLYHKSETIESLVERTLWMKDINGISFISEAFINNLKQCKLTNVSLEIKKE